MRTSYARSIQAGNPNHSVNYMSIPHSAFEQARLEVMAFTAGTLLLLVLLVWVLAQR